MMDSKVELHLHTDYYHYPYRNSFWMTKNEIDSYHQVLLPIKSNEIEQLSSEHTHKRTYTAYLVIEKEHFGILACLFYENSFIFTKEIELLRIFHIRFGRLIHIQI